MVVATLYRACRTVQMMAKVWLRYPSSVESGVPTTWPSSLALHEAWVAHGCTPPRPCDMKHELIFTAGLLDEL